MSANQITEQRIRELAYELWERAGRQEGSANRFWDEAERQLKEQRNRAAEGATAK